MEFRPQNRPLRVYAKALKLQRFVDIGLLEYVYRTAKLYLKNSGLQSQNTDHLC